MKNANFGRPAQFDCATKISVENSVVNSVDFLGFLVLHFYNSFEFLGFYNSVAFSVEQSNCAPGLLFVFVTCN